MKAVLFGFIINLILATTSVFAESPLSDFQYKPEVLAAESNCPKNLELIDIELYSLKQLDFETIEIKVLDPVKSGITLNDPVMLKWDQKQLGYTGNLTQLFGKKIIGGMWISEDYLLTLDDTQGAWHLDYLNTVTLKGILGAAMSVAMGQNTCSSKVISRLNPIF